MQYYNYLGKVSMQTREFEGCDIDATRIVALRPLLMENLKSPYEHDNKPIKAK